jgi:hypothetical protein
MPVNWSGTVYPTGAVPGQAAPIANRFVGRFDGNHPTSGTFQVGDWTLDVTGSTFWICTAAGSPGTWADVTATGAVTSVFGRTGAVVAVSGDYTAAQVTNAPDLSSASDQDFTGQVSAPRLEVNGGTGAASPTRLIGANATGAPGSGTWELGDIAVAQNGHLFVCTVAGTPGTWVDTGSVGNQVTSVFARTGAVVATSGDYTAAQVTNAADLSSSSDQDFTGQVSAPRLEVNGNTGATLVTRLIGGNASGAPASGTWEARDCVINTDGTIWVCTVAGTPGTWVQVGGGGGVTPAMVTVAGSASADYTTTSTTFVDISADLNTTIGAAVNDQLLVILQLTVNPGSGSPAYRWTFNVGGTDVGDTLGLVDGPNAAVAAQDSPLQVVYPFVATGGQISGGTIAVHPRWFVNQGTGEVRNTSGSNRPRLTIINLKH